MMILLVLCCLKLVTSKIYSDYDIVSNSVCLLKINYNKFVHADIETALRNVLNISNNIQYDFVNCQDNCSAVNINCKPPVVEDRSCLLQSSLVERIAVPALILAFPVSLSITDAMTKLVAYINKHCNTFLMPDGNISVAHVKHLLMSDDLFDISNDQSCDTVNANDLSFEDFNNNYWLRQKPLVIKNFLELPVNVKELFFSSTSAQFDYYENEVVDESDLSVSVKLNPIIDYEGIDSVMNWEMVSTQYVPPQVLNQLISPDLVIVRAVHKDMTLHDALLLMSANQLNNSILNPSEDDKSVFAYVEYLNAKSIDLKEIVNKAIGNVTPHLRTLIGNPSMDEMNKLHMLNGEPYLWLSNGHTIGKLHYDPFDNILVQAQGVKSFILIPPSYGTEMAEGHMREANIEWIRDDNDDDGGNREYKFVKRILTESTSMVHTPLYFEHEYTSNSNSNSSTRYRHYTDISKRKSVLYQGLNKATRKNRREGKNKIPIINNCDVYPGDAIYIPSYYWHEVISYPLHSNTSSLGDMDINFAIVVLI